MRIKCGWGWCFVVSCLMVACTEKKKDFVPDEVVQMDVVGGSIGEVLDTVVYLPLELSESAALSRVHKMWADDSLYFLADFNYSKIAVYAHDGKLKYVLDKRGHGQGEYLEIRNFTVDGDRLYTIDNFQHQIHIYGKNTGTYVESKPADVIASDIVAFGKDGFLLAAIPNGQAWAVEQPKNLVFRTDGDFKVKDAYFPYEEAYCEPLSRYSYFSATDSSVIFSSFRFDGLTEIMKSGKQAVHSVLMDLKHPIPEGLRAKTESYDGSSPYEFVVQTPVVCRQYWFVEVTKDKKSECYVYDRHAGKFYGNDGQATDRMAFIVGSDGTHFIGYVPDKAYYEELVKFGLHKADSLTEERLEQGGSALVLYRMQ